LAPVQLSHGTLSHGMLSQGMLSQQDTLSHGSSVSQAMHSQATFGHATPSHGAVPKLEWCSNAKPKRGRPPSKAKSSGVLHQAFHQAPSPFISHDPNAQLPSVNSCAKWLPGPGPSQPPPPWAKHSMPGASTMTLSWKPMEFPKYN
jgi:hypothetical protein